MIKENKTNNDVNGAATPSVSPSSVRNPAGEQRGPDRIFATAQTKRKESPWSIEVNKLVMRCFYYAKMTRNVDSKRKGYRQRMLARWMEIGLFESSEQRLACQKRAITTNGWFSEAELSEIEKEVRREIEGPIVTQPDLEETETEVEEKEPELEENEPDVDETEENMEVEELVVEEWHASQPVEAQVDSLIGAIRQGTDGSSNILIGEDMTEEMKQIVNEIAKLMKTDEAPPNLRHVERKKLNEEAKKVNEALQYIQTGNITHTNKLLKAAGCLVAMRLGIKKKKEMVTKEPWWKRRIKRKIETLRKDLSRLERLASGELKNRGKKEDIKKKYNLQKEDIKTVIETIKQRITANATKLGRYEARNEQYMQNRMFRINQKKLFERLEKGDGQQEEIKPNKEEALEFWGNIWEKPVEHNPNAKWIKKVEEEIGPQMKQDNICITERKLKKQIQKMSNWTAPGPDGLQGFWLKAFTRCHQRIVIQLQSCLSSTETPAWLTKGKTVLINKDREKGSVASNYRPITCLPLMWKLFTGVISDEIYTYLEEKKILPEEQKGCRKGTRGTKDQLLIDKMILKNCRRRRTGLAMAWVDYKKAYDMVPHSWIRKCTEIFGVAENVRGLLESSMKKWKTELTSCGESFGTIKIKRGIFQGDSLSPLLFVMTLIPLSLILRKVRAGYAFGRGKPTVNHLLFMDDLKVYGKNEKQVNTMINTVRIFSQDICMEFGIDKCAVIVLKKGKLIKTEGITLPNGKEIKSLEEGEGYKYLGILEAENIKNKEMKEKTKKEYFRRVRRILKSKLNAGNIITAINSRAVSMIRYGAGIINWTKEELRCMDRKTRKLLTIHRTMHPQSDTDRLYMRRREGGRGLMSVEDCVSAETNSLFNYVENAEELLLKSVQDEGLLQEGVTRKETLVKRERNFLSKALHPQFFQRTQELRDESSWNWLRNGTLKKETEGMIIAAQDQALRTNQIRNRIDKMEVSPMCRMCGDREETVAHIVAECKMLAQKQYKIWRHDRVATVIHWNLCKQYGFEHHEKWYEHAPVTVLENEEIKILWDFSVQTDRRLDHNKPDLIVLKKKERECWIIDVACPFDTRVKQKESEKIERYHDLKMEIKKMWKCKKVTVTPIVIGALGTIGVNLDKWLKKVGMEKYKDIMQKACLLGTARILRKVLDT